MIKRLRDFSTHIKGSAHDHRATPLTRRPTWGTCNVPINEVCRIHPVNCPGCLNGDICRMRSTFKAHPDKLKRCRFYQPKKAWANIT